MAVKVLFVDDEDHILDAFRREFRNQFEIHCADGAMEGLRLLSEEGPFAVVVSDWRMPGMDGVSFLGEVTRRSPETTRIMLTGHGTQHLAVDAVNLGHLFRFHAKPFDSRELMRSIQDGIDEYNRVSGPATASAG